MEYRDLLRTSWRYLAFGSLLTCLGTLGSAYFVGLFNGDIRREFELSHADIGLVFSITTLASGPALVWLGRKIDDVDLRLYSVSLFAGFAAGCFLVASSTSIIAIAAGIFLVRLIGDWLIVHTAVTSMARYFGSKRGTALGSGAVGYALGPAVFPVMAALLVSSVGWRATWMAIGVAFLLVFIPLVLWLLRGKGESHRRFLRPASTGDGRSGDGNAAWSRLEVLQDIRFYLAMPVAIGLPFILSGFFFHQVALVEAKGWNLTRLASYFVGFAAAKAAIMLVIGPLIDRFGAARLLPFYPLAMAAGLFALAVSDHPEIALAYLVGCGISTGMWMVMTGALWAELYGMAHLGAIRSMAQAIFILSVALGTAGMGWLLDLGFTFEVIALASIAYIAVGIALSVFLARR